VSWEEHNETIGSRSSLLTQGAGVLSAEVDLTINGVVFGEIVLLPAVQ